MLNKLRARMQDEKGFTLIELLVVILIIGILAAIALPAFLNQREKAQDSTATSDARTAQTALETWYTHHQFYTGATQATLEGIEPALKNVALTFPTAPDDTKYGVTVESKGSNKITYTITNNAGVVTRTCSKAGSGGCGAADATSGNMW
jgi:type IV pilus assembly protein PilA